MIFALAQVSGAAVADPLIAFAGEVAKHSPLLALVAVAAWIWFKTARADDGAGEAAKAIADAGTQIAALSSRVAALEAEKAEEAQQRREAQLVDTAVKAALATRTTGDFGITKDGK